MKSPQGKAVVGADIEVTSSSGDTVFKTKSAFDGSFVLSINPGKYRVEISADDYLQFSYVLDLRSGASVEPVDMWLQGLGQCHDVRIISSNTDQDRCSSEVLSPNLGLAVRTTISGQVKDETGAPFKHSEVELKKLSDSILQPARLDTKTDENGNFNFDEAEPGKYRLLASPNRGFAQPENLNCYGRPNCNFEIVLKVNPTDQPYAGCPVQ